MNQIFTDAVAGIKSIALALESEVVRLDNLASAKRAEEHLLAVARQNRDTFETEMHVVKDALLNAKRDLENAQDEAVRVLADAKRQAGELVANGRQEADRLISAAHQKIADARSRFMEISS